RNEFEKGRRPNRRWVMFTGKLIDELMATVERAEQQRDSQGDSAEIWCNVAPYELAAMDANLIGVA
ncbi:MAG TPA: hypothetical protein VK639_01865, partial [Terriglobales bacterium]|nr:hypothetical protein [Terriglobales bacterium]